MPELPDVQVFKEYLDASALHQRVADVPVIAADMLEGVSARTLKSRLRGRALSSTERHGKHLFARIEDDGWLRLHFGMTGALKYYKVEEESPDHVRLRLDFENGYHLAYRNIRRLGQIGLVEHVDTFVDRAGLGPDPLAPEFDLGAFREALSGRRGTIKGALMNQRVIAGIGNIYADEILFRARLHPEARVNRLTDSTIRDLYRSLSHVLEKAIDARADPQRLPRSFLLAQREKGGECPRCSRKLSTTKVAGRTTYYCRHGQRRKS